MAMTTDNNSRGIRFVTPSLDLPNTGAVMVYEPEGEQIKESVEVEISNVDEGKIVYRESLATVRDAANRDERIDLTNYITPERYRFIDCKHFAQDGILALWEMEHLPVGRYIAISHVWKSLPPEEDDILTKKGSFLAECEDRNDGGPMSIDVLHWTALAALQIGIRLLWLDRLCILQTPTEAGRLDKPWQIKKMYRVYKDCAACFVLPAGLRRFTEKMEDTTWMTRAWTFQEVMVPPIVEVLFTSYVGKSPAKVVQKMEGVKYFTMVNQSVYDDSRDGTAATREQFAQALQLRDHFVEMSRKPRPETGSLGQFYDIWRFVQWRISARPVDVVFSVMGLLGVDLDPKRFGREDRFSATLAMAQQLLYKDSSKNACIEVPLWKWMPKDRWKAVDELPTVYMANLPKRIKLQDLEAELGTQVIHRFRSATTTPIATRGNMEGATTLDETEFLIQSSIRNLVIMGSGGNAEDVIRDWMTSNATVATRSSQLAERMAKELPVSLLLKTFETRSSDRVVYTSSESVVLELLHELSDRASSETVTLPLRATGSTHSRHVYGWCIRSILWVKLGRYSRTEEELYGNIQGERKYGSVAVPVLTLWKFDVPTLENKS